MRQLYIFTAGDASARVHLDDSITKPVSSARLGEHLEQGLANYIQSLLPDPQYFYAWGAVPGERNIPVWGAMQVGDVVLTVYDNFYHYVSAVIAKVQSADLAKSIWGTDAAGNTWEYMYILSEPQKIKVHVASQPVVDYLNNGYRGFTRISENKLLVIRTQFGSLEKFIENIFSAMLPPTVIESELKLAELNSESHVRFDPKNLVDGRRRVISEVVRRQGQLKFRRDLIAAYKGRCAVTGCDVEAVLEAAHIIPYAGAATNNVTNGILLRADVHTLFDLGLLKIDQLGMIHVGDILEYTPYKEYQGKRANLPSDSGLAPHKDALAVKFAQIL